MADNKHIRICYTPGETGWAEDMEGGLARICNIPLCDNLNIDDVVRLTDFKDGFKEVAEVIRKGFPLKTCLHYHTPDQFKALALRVRAANQKIEGMVAPYERDGKDYPGLALVAHHDDFDPVAVAKELGIEHPEGEKDLVCTEDTNNGMS